MGGYIAKNPICLQMGGYNWYELNFQLTKGVVELDLAQSQIYNGLQIRKWAQGGPKIADRVWKGVYL